MSSLIPYVLSSLAETRKIAPASSFISLAELISWTAGNIRKGGALLSSAILWNAATVACMCHKVYQQLLGYSLLQNTFLQADLSHNLQFLPRGDPTNLCAITRVWLLHGGSFSIYRNDPWWSYLAHEVLVYFCCCFFETGRFFFFWKAAECNQSFDFYLTEDLRDWSKDLLYLDPSVR